MEVDDTFVILDGGSPTGSINRYEEVDDQHGILNGYFEYGDSPAVEQPFHERDAG